MREIKKAARGTNESGKDGGNGGTTIATFSVAQRTPDCQPHHFCDSLIAQAESRMQTDPARYGVHFAVWLSLYSLAHSLPWPGVDYDA